MDQNDIAKIVDHERWLLNAGLISDSAKNQLFMYGSIVHLDVRAVELKVIVEDKKVNYIVYVDKKVIKKRELFDKLKNSTGWWGLWRLRRLLKKEGNLNFELLISRFVRDFCGPAWKTQVEVIDYAEYKEDFGDETRINTDSISDDQRSNRGPRS